MNYTKGEWKVASHPLVGIQVQADTGERRISICNLQDEANAHLIAAAPDMYEALLLALPLLHDDWDGTSSDSAGNVAIARVGQALAKAEGKGDA